MNDVEKVRISAVLRFIAMRNGQHLRESISVRDHVQRKYDPHLQVDEGWDDSTEELVTEIFTLPGDTSRTLSEMHYRIAILRSKVRPETFLNPYPADCNYCAFTMFAQNWHKKFQMGREPW